MATDEGRGRTVTATVGLRLPGGTLEAEVAMPAEPVALESMLPLARALTDRVVELATHAEEAAGRRVSCRAGCGACCRQLVPVSEVEARRLRDLVAALPEPRRSAVRARFAEAHRRLEQAGLLEPLRDDDRNARSRDERGRLGRAYFAAGIPCPFLEDESCSIHPERPLTCREYLVTTPPDRCAGPTPGAVRGVDLHGSVWLAFARLCDPAPAAEAIRWVPLVLAPEWADAHPDGPPPRPGPDWFRDLLARFARRDLPGPPADAAPGSLG